MEDFLEKECQDIDYTIVRPPRLIDGHIIGKSFSPDEDRRLSFTSSLEKEMKVCEDDYFFPDFSTANKTPRANVARFMLDTLKNQTYIRQGVAIDLPKMLDKSGWTTFKHFDSMDGQVKDKRWLPFSLFFKPIQ